MTAVIVALIGAVFGAVPLLFRDGKAKQLDLLEKELAIAKLLDGDRRENMDSLITERIYRYAIDTPGRRRRFVMRVLAMFMITLGLAGMVALQVNHSELVKPMELTHAERSRWQLAPGLLIIVGFLWFLAASTDGGLTNRRQAAIQGRNWRAETPEFKVAQAKRAADEAKRQAKARKKIEKIHRQAAPPAPPSAPVVDQT